jgi:hypothetical protein
VWQRLAVAVAVDVVAAAAAAPTRVHGQHNVAASYASSCIIGICASRFISFEQASI